MFRTEWKLTDLIPVPLGTHFNWLREAVSHSFSPVLLCWFVKGGGDVFVA